MSRVIPSAPLASTMLDHVAVAAEQWSEAWPRYAVELGGKWSSGGLDVGFGPAQLRYANGAKVEILQPWRPEDNPFLRRFLDRNGEGPHHITFRVPDIDVALESARARGFNPVGVDTTDQWWKEAFLHPRQATGIVVQLAQAAADWSSPAPKGFPDNTNAAAASLVRVTHAVADLDGALGLFGGLLQGTTERTGISPDGSWTYADLSWGGPLALRLIAPAPDVADGPVATWLGGRPGRLHHLAFSFDSAPDSEAPGWSVQPELPGVLRGEGVEVVEPDQNLGTRLVLLRGGGES